ncbi:Uncharacterised protein [Mycobacteroides abscessus]|nr:Uncharacterised protein [Mycobacteroides abscessus]
MRYSRDALRASRTVGPFSMLWIAGLSIVGTARMLSGIVTSTTSPGNHERDTLTYVPGTASSSCSTPLTVTVKPLRTQPGTRRRRSSRPEPFTVSRVAPTFGYCVSWTTSKPFSSHVRVEAR